MEFKELVEWTSEIMLTQVERQVYRKFCEENNLPCDPYMGNKDTDNALEDALEKNLQKLKRTLQEVVYHG